MAKRKHRRSGRVPRRSFKIRLKKGTVYSIAQVLFFALAGLTIVSFARQGLILIRLNDLLITVFGWATVFLPFIFLSFAFLISKFKNPLSQPNVLVGGVLFVISVAVITKSGLAGKSAWEGIETLITPAGAFIVLTGATIVGLIILFNTSLGQVLSVIALFLSQIRRYLIGEKIRLSSKGLPSKETLLSRGPLKVAGGEEALKQEPLAPKLVSNMPGGNSVWEYPPIDLLTEKVGGHADRGDIKGNAAIIEKTLESFGITARVIEVNLGPAVTQYAIEVALGTKLSKITALERDLALALAAPTGTIRIEAPIPGRSLVGIELPNRHPEFVPLRKIMEADIMREAKSKLTVSLGSDVSGKPVVANLSRMPHVLIAGQTGSGKSVAINAFLACILMRSAPSEVKLILVDPKRVELTNYNGIPHLLTPVIIEPEKVVSALKWVQTEMDRRYKLFAQAGVRNIDGYNEMSGFQALPYIVVFIDELADIMLFAPNEVEDAITRIAQMSRATGIHMVVATQRPSVDVITGLIKANIPCRIAFAVASQIDSRVILDTQGAEKLLGRGDMLYLPPEQAKPVRIQGAYVTDQEVNSLISFLKNQGVPVQYTEEVTAMPQKTALGLGLGDEKDELFDEAVRIVCQYDKASSSLLQRRLSVGYARAARIIDQLEKFEVVGPAEGSKPRDVLIQNADEFLSGFSKGQ
ncbi:DNA translocase FtsK [Candidatus Woesebacteria bacterium]|nr:DNA translocase FtsK [Candidatus Woesebacteria bacterium]